MLLGVAALASARVNVEQLKVAYGTAQAQLKSAQATLVIRQAAFDRQNALVQQGVNSNSTLDDTKISLEQAQAALDLANQQVAASTAALAGDPNIATDKHPAVLAAQAAVEQAQRNLTKTTVTAPSDGIVSPATAPISGPRKRRPSRRNGWASWRPAGDHKVAVSRRCWRGSRRTSCGS